MKTKIVCLYGSNGVGKSTIADCMQSLGWRVMSLADPIREMLACVVGEDSGRYVDKNSPNSDLCGKSIRYAMKTLGTEWGRNMIGEGIWVSLLLKRMSLDGFEKVVIDDARMPNEYNVLKSYGAKFVRVKRKEADDRWADEVDVLIQKGIPIHDSELHWPYWTPDFVVTNDSPIVCASVIDGFCTTFK